MATRLPLAASRPVRPLPWPVVAGLVAVVVALLLGLTVYLPARQAAANGNTVHVQDLAIGLSASPDRALPHTAELRVSFQPELPPDAGVELAASMPTMANMPAERISDAELTAGSYRAVAQLGMAGPWQVLVTVRRPGRPDAIARFRLNA